MFREPFKCFAAAAAGLGLAAASAVQAQTEPPIEAIKRMVEQALPPVFQDENSGLVQNLLGVELGEPLSKGFDYTRVRGALFGRTAPNVAPDCQRTGSPVGDPEQDDCTASAGQENGGGEYKALRFSKNMGLGNIKYLYRPVAPSQEQELDPNSIQVKLNDTDAYQTAVKFLNETLGVPLNEIARPPAGAALPVKSLAIGGNNGEGPTARLEPVIIRKVVFLPRGLTLPEPIRDAKTGLLLTKVPAPGEAWVALVDPRPNDLDPAKRIGIQAAMVSDWQELRPNPNIDPRMAKSRGQLVQEISEELANDGGGVPSFVRILIGLSSEFQGTHGLLLPAVKVFASPVPALLSEEEQASLEGKSTAGQVFEVPLVNSGDRNER
jgi:hypothetical protein